MRGYALTGEQAQLEPYERARGEIAPAGRKLLSLETEPGQRAQARALIRELERYAASLAAVIERPDSSSAATARETERGLLTFRADLAKYAVDERAEQMRLREEGGRLRNRAIRIAAGGLVLLLVLIGLLAFGAVRAIVGPVSRLQRFARELGAGRFGTRLPETGPPETAELAHAFNLSAETLQRSTERHLAELDAVFRDSPLGIAFLDLDLRFLRVNEALARMNQVPVDEHLGRTVGEVTGQHDVERALRSVVETGEPLLDLDVALHGRRFEATYFAVRDDRGELLAVGKSMIDVTARRRAESARERLQAPPRRSRARSLSPTWPRGGRAGGLALDASAAVLLTLDAERGAADRGPTRASGGARALDSLPFWEPMPATDAARHGRGRLHLRRGNAARALPGAGRHALPPRRRVRGAAAGRLRPHARRALVRLLPTRWLRRRRARAADGARRPDRDRARPCRALRARAHRFPDAAGVTAAARAARRARHRPRRRG